MDRKVMAAVRKWVRGKRRQYKVYEDGAGYSAKLVEDAALQVMESEDFEWLYGRDLVPTLDGQGKLNAVFQALYPATWLKFATDGSKWSEAINAVADGLGLIPDGGDAMDADGWLEAVRDGRVDAAWEVLGHDRLDGGSWQVDVAIHVEIDGETVAKVGGWVAAGRTQGQGVDIDGSGNWGTPAGTWQVRAGFGGDDCGRPKIVAECDGGVWSVVNSVRNGSELTLSIPSVSEETAEELAGCLDRLVQAAYDGVEIVSAELEGRRD